MADVDSTGDYFQVYYAQCPEDFTHWILFDSSAPGFDPDEPLRRSRCYLCGPDYVVKIEKPLKLGWVDFEEFQHLYSLREPRSKPTAKR